VNTVVSMQFNEPVDPVTVGSHSWNVGGLAGTYGVSADGCTVTFVPTPARASTRYSSWTVYYIYDWIRDLPAMPFRPTASASPPFHPGHHAAFGTATSPAMVQPTCLGREGHRGFNEPIDMTAADLVTLAVRLAT